MLARLGPFVLAAAAAASPAAAQAPSRGADLRATTPHQPVARTDRDERDGDWRDRDRDHGHDKRDGWRDRDRDQRDGDWRDRDDRWGRDRDDDRWGRDRDDDRWGRDGRWERDRDDRWGDRSRHGSHRCDDHACRVCRADWRDRDDRDRHARDRHDRDRCDAWERTHGRSHRHASSLDRVRFVTRSLGGRHERVYECGCRHAWQAGRWDDRGHQRTWQSGRYASVRSCNDHRRD